VPANLASPVPLNTDMIPTAAGVGCDLRLIKLMCEMAVSCGLSGRAETHAVLAYCYYGLNFLRALLHRLTRASAILTFACLQEIAKLFSTESLR